MFKTLTTRGLRPATPENAEAIDMAIMLLSKALYCARQSDEAPAVKSIFAALRAAKGARQRLNRRLRAFSCGTVN